MALKVITPPLTDTALRDLRRRTAARLMAARVEMRAGWLLHPDNAVRPKLMDGFIYGSPFDGRHALIIDYSPSLYIQQVGRGNRDWSVQA